MPKDKNSPKKTAQIFEAMTKAFVSGKPVAKVKKKGAKK
jgi:hypothetical protein